MRPRWPRPTSRLTPRPPEAAEAKRPDLPVERKVATTEVKTLHGTGKTQAGMASYYGTEFRPADLVGRAL